MRAFKNKVRMCEKEKKKVVMAVQTLLSKDRCTDEHIYVKMIFLTVRVGDVFIIYKRFYMFCL